METQNTTVQLELSDITLMLSIISTCSQRGAFSPEEFTVVGGLWEKLKAFLPVQGEDEGQEETAVSVSSGEGESNTIAVDFSQPKA